jgi:hypothetical protein
LTNRNRNQRNKPKKELGWSSIRTLKQLHASLPNPNYVQTIDSTKGIVSNQPNFVKRQYKDPKTGIEKIEVEYHI